jgi:predicted NAD/FAD-binding protein
MVRDILRFNREAPRLLVQPGPEMPLGRFLEDGRYGQAFRSHYILPMGAAIWSAEPASMFQFPARFFVRFLHNHGMLTVNDGRCGARWRAARHATSKGSSRHSGTGSASVPPSNPSAACPARSS